MSLDDVHIKDDLTVHPDPTPASSLMAGPPGGASPIDGDDDFMVSLNDEEDDANKENDHEEDIPVETPPEESDVAEIELIKKSTPSTDLEKALTAAMARKDVHIQRLMDEINKLRAFISKRKQTYKRKRKEDGAPTRALSAYNMFIKDRFAELAKQNEEALMSADADAALKRVPPANLVTKTGNEWKDLPADVKAKYEERAKVDRKRYEEEMSLYQPPDKQTNRKRNKTGYNMFFSAHVLRLKATENGVPSERGSVARLVGTAWKQLSAEEKQYFEREADKHNGMTPTKEEVEEEDEEDTKRHHQQHIEQHYPMHPGAPHGVEMHFMPPPPPPPMHMQPHPHHQPDPRHYHHPYPPPHMYPQPPYPHYDYSQHHQRHQSRSAGGYGHNQGYSGSRHPYDATL